MFSGIEGLRYGVKMCIRGYADGETYVLNHLTSEKGRRMNRRRCVVVGRDTVAPADDSNNDAHVKLRVKVRLLNPDTLRPEGNILRIAQQNLVDLRFYSSTASRTVLPEEEVLRRLNRAMDHAVAEGYDAPLPSDEGAQAFRDREKRCSFLRSYLPGSLPPPSKCMDYMIPRDEQHDHELLRNACIPACTGDGLVDFARFGEGLVGVGDDCPICKEPVFAKALRLPCNHMFHYECAKMWLDKHENCPTCRKDLVNPWSTYVYKADEQIQRRMEEWFLSGMCERCQASYQENDPIVEVTHGGPSVLMPLSEATRRGLYSYESIQGQGRDTVVIPQ